MALLHGKQIAGTSVSLGKLDGTGIVEFTLATMSFEAGAVLTTDDSNIINGIDVVNKNYVDAVASGLDPKESVRVKSSLPITLFGTQSVDNYLLEVGDRVLVNNQDGATPSIDNGIYVVSAGTWSRALDSDGNPNGEVSLGNFTFVEKGDTWAGTGWVLSISDALNPSDIDINTETQKWVQFSSAGVIQAGAGLTKTGNTIDVGAGTGITVSSTQVSLTDTGVSASSYGDADSVATFTVDAQGRLTLATDVLIDITSGQVNNFTSSVDTLVFDSANFVGSDTVDFTVTAGSSVTAEVIINGTSSGLTTSSNGLSVNVDGITIIVNNNGELEVDASAVVPNVSNGLSIDSGDIVLGGTLSQNTTIDADTNNFQLTNASNVLFNTEVFDVEANGLISLDAGTGSVQVLADDSVTISASNSVNLVTNGDLDISFDTGNITDNSGNGYGVVYTTDYSGTFVTNSLITKKYVDDLVNAIPEGDITEVIAGDGLIGGGTFGSVTLDVVGGTGINVNADDIEINFTEVATGLDGNGLVANGGVLDVDFTSITGAGLTQNGSQISVDYTATATALAGNGLTASGTELDVNVNADSLEIVGDVIRLKDTIDGDRTFADSVTIQGNLIVEGTQSIINTENIFIEDNIITLNATYSGPYNVVDAGIEANLGGGTFAALIWDASESLWAAGFSGSTSTIITEAGTGLTKSGNTLSIDTAGFADDLAGAGLTSAAGVINVGAGTGITVNADDVAVDFASITGTGLTQNGSQISVDFTNVSTALAGAGLTANGSTLDIRAENGLNVDLTSDAVELGGNLTKFTQISGGQTLLLGGNGGFSLNIFDVRAKDINIQANELTGGDRSITVRSGYTYSLRFGTDGIGGGLVTDGSGNGYGLVYTSDYTGTFVTNSLITKQYVDAAVAANTSGVSDITAGAGLTATGTTGSVTLNVGAGSGITVNTDDVAVDYVTVAQVMGGAGLTANGDVFDVVGGDGIVVNADDIEVDLATNSGLSFTGGQLTVDSSIAGTGLTFSSGVLSVVAGNAQPVYQLSSPSVTSGNDSITGITLSSTPNDYSRIEVYINGQRQRLGNGVTTLDCYFGTQSGTPIILTDILSGYELFWNGVIAGFELSATDNVEIVYEA
jgi:hypothetical protein